MESTSCTLELVSPDVDLAGYLRRCEASDLQLNSTPFVGMGDRAGGQTSL